MPDKPVGRHRKLTPPPVKRFALEKQLPVYQPLSLKEDQFGETFYRIDPDCIVVAAFGRILPPYILDYPKLGCVNIHASLLPAYRGASPIHTTVINGEKQSGVTIMKMARGLDTGDMILQKAIDLAPDETTGTLHDRLASLGADMIVEYIHLALAGKVTAKKQDEAKATYAAKIDFDTRRIDFANPIFAVYARIRGLSPVPGAICFTKDTQKQIKLIKVTPTNRAVLDAQPGSVHIEGKQILVACRDFYLSLCMLQEQGGKPMDSAAFLNGRKLSEGEILVP